MGNIIYNMCKEYQKLNSMKALSDANLFPYDVSKIEYVLRGFIQGVVKQRVVEENVASWFKGNGCKVHNTNGWYLISII